MHRLVDRQRDQVWKLGPIQPRATTIVHSWRPAFSFLTTWRNIRAHQAERGATTANVCDFRAQAWCEWQNFSHPAAPM